MAVILNKKNTRAAQAANPFSNYKKKVLQTYTDSFKDYCIFVAKYMYQEGYKRAIDFFYNDYTPRSYKRTHSLYKAANNHPMNFKKNENKILDYKYHKEYIKTGTGAMSINKLESCVVTMIIDSTNITKDPYNRYEKRKDRNRTRWVFERSYMGLIHGFTAQENKEWINTTHNTWKSNEISHIRKYFIVDGLPVQGDHINRYNEESRWWPMTNSSDVPYSKSNGVNYSYKSKSGVKTTNNLQWLTKKYLNKIRDNVKNGYGFNNIFRKNMLKNGLYK